MRGPGKWDNASGHQDGKTRPDGELPVVAVIVVRGQDNLLEVVLALEAVGGLAHLLDGGQEQADEHRDDRDDDQQLDQREGRAALGTCHGEYLLGRTDG